jgi:hypothetical protein
LKRTKKSRAIEIFVFLFQAIVNSSEITKFWKSKEEKTYRKTLNRHTRREKEYLSSLYFAQLQDEEDNEKKEYKTDKDKDDKDDENKDGKDDKDYEDDKDNENNKDDINKDEDNKDKRW